MNKIAYITLLIVLVGLGTFKSKFLDQALSKSDSLIANHLHNNDDIFRSSLPTLWIHLDRVPNARHWLSWGGRQTNFVNLPYLNLCVKTIIDRCGESFNIALIDDASFHKLIPDWNIDLSKVSARPKDNLRSLALCKVLHNYGGLLVPSSFVCLRNLKDMFYRTTGNGKCVAAVLPVKSFSGSGQEMSPSLKFLGCEKHCQGMGRICRHLELLCSKSSWSALDFVRDAAEMLSNAARTGHLNLIEPEFTGVRDKHGRQIYLSRLMSDSTIYLHERSLGLYVPRNELVARLEYGWFCRMDAGQVMESKTNIGKYLLVASAL